MLEWFLKDHVTLKTGVEFHSPRISLHIQEFHSPRHMCCGNVTVKVIWFDLSNDAENSALHHRNKLHLHVYIVEHKRYLLKTLKNSYRAGLPGFHNKTRPIATQTSPVVFEGEPQENPCFRGEYRRLGNTVTDPTFLLVICDNIWFDLFLNAI